MMTQRNQGEDVRRQSLGLTVRAACLLISLCLYSACSEPGPKSPAGSQFKAWKEHSGNPVIKQGDAIPAMLWNDPSVLQEGDGYRMWLSGGDPRDLNHIVVKVYEARSRDGKSWQIDTHPVVSPGPAAWDSLRIETPSVIKVDGVYHMYYSGYDEKGAREGSSSIGHATSKDGTNWVKDPANPVISAQAKDKSEWGFHGAGEPGVVYNPKDKTFYLYYVSMRYARAQPTIGHIGILLAKSRDGSKFTSEADERSERVAVMTKEIKEATPGAWFGYSTPAAIIDRDGEFELFCALIVAPRGPTTARHVGLVRAKSKDGIHFKLVEDGIFYAGKDDWKDDQVRAPTVVQDEDGRLHIWFAGDMRKPHFSAGIGFATREPD
jgi:predicted GH43/DUF377 family glycosyl hydrolase